MQKGENKGKSEMESTTKPTEGKRTTRLNQSVILVIMIVVLAVIATIVNPRFLRITNIINIFQQIAVLGIVASGVGMLLVSGNIDISVGSQVSLLGVVIAMVIQRMMGLPAGDAEPWKQALAVPVAILVTFAIGGTMGIINGITVVKSRAASFIISLGFMTTYHGAALLISGGASYMLFGRFEWIGRGRIFNVVPISILFFIGMAVLTYIILKFFRYGRFLYAIGGNKKAAFVSGINTDRTIITGYIVTGFCNALAAIILISRVGSALATTGDNYALDALAAVIVGGVSIFGGKGTAVNIFLGVILIGVIGNALIIMNINPFVRDVVIGLVIIVAVTVSQFTGDRE